VTGPILLVSNPPHGDVDLAKASPILGLVPADLRLKAHYPVPEIVLAEDDPAVAERAAAALREAAFHVAVVPGRALAEIPDRRPVPLFDFQGDALVLEADVSLRLPYEAPLVAVQFAGRPGETKGPIPHPFLDLYALTGGTLQRWTFAQGATVFEGLGERATASFGTNLQTLAEEIEERFAAATVDRRLVNMQVRRRVGTPPAGVQRRGFSYATAPLNALLERLRPGLSELEHQELASRLVFLTHAGASGH
jgi:hypothetical protein